jgi:hypothetical protein
MWKEVFIAQDRAPKMYFPEGNEEDNKKLVSGLRIGCCAYQI